MILREISPSADARLYTVSRVRVTEGAHDEPRQVEDHVEVWNHGAFAGTLEVKSGEGEAIARHLMPDAEVVRVVR